MAQFESQKSVAVYLSRYHIAKAEVKDVEQRIDRARAEMMGVKAISYEGGAVLDRLIIIPFNAEFDKSDPDYDPFLKYKLIEQEPVQYMIRLGVQGLRRILEGNRGFTKSTQVQQQLDEYNEANNPILGFIKDTDVDVDIINCPTRDVYRRYTVFCNDNGFTPVGNKVFVRQINLLLGLMSRQIRDGNKRIQVFDKE